MTIFEQDIVLIRSIKPRPKCVAIVGQDGERRLLSIIKGYVNEAKRLAESLSIAEADTLVVYKQGDRRKKCDYFAVYSRPDQLLAEEVERHNAEQLKKVPK